MSGRELALDWRWLICATLSAWGPPPPFRHLDKSLPPAFAECLLSSGDVEEAGDPVMSEEGSCTQETHLPPGQGDRSGFTFPGRATMPRGDVPNSFSEPRGLIWKEE